jgi:hypothetical protein
MAAATTPPVGIFYRKFYLVIYDLLWCPIHYYYYRYSTTTTSSTSTITVIFLPLLPSSSSLLLTVEHRLHSRDELQLEEYLVKKAELAGIMRDFTDNKSYFVAIDGSLVAMTEYQEISKRIKRGTTYCTLRTLWINNLLTRW